MNDINQARLELIAEAAEAFVAAKYPDRLSELKDYLSELGPDALEPPLATGTGRGISPIEFGLTVVWVPFLVDVMAGLVTERIVRELEKRKRARKTGKLEEAKRGMLQELTVQTKRSTRTVREKYVEYTHDGKQVRTDETIQEMSEVTWRVIEKHLESKDED